MSTPELPIASFSLHLLGPFAASVNGTALPPLRTRKDAWLLGLLVLHHPRPLDRAWLAGLLGVRVGDVVEVDLLEGQRRTVRLPISALVEDYFGIQGMMDSEALARLMREAPAANSVLDPGKAEAAFCADLTVAVAWASGQDGALWLIRAIPPHR